MDKKFDYYTTYLKGHASQNDDNPVVKHNYMNVLLEFKRIEKEEKKIINFVLTKC